MSSADICTCCNGDPDTVCAACGEHSCWAGVMYCENYKTAGTKQKPAPVPTPAQWASWFRHCAAEADEMTEDHRKVFRLVAEHFEHDWIVRKVADITGVDS